MTIDVTFDYDFDSDLYMVAGDPDAGNWTVIVHCKNGKTHITSPEHFAEYPGCETHEGEIAWYVDHFGAEKVEVQRSGQESVFVRHPNMSL